MWTWNSIIFQFLIAPSEKLDKNVCESQMELLKMQNDLN